MPPRLNPNGASDNAHVDSEILTKDLGYEYPGGRDLRPSSDLHKKIVGKVMEYARESKDAMQPRYAAWKEIDHTLTSYIQADSAEARLLSKDARKPVSIVVPISSAILDTWLTYFMRALAEMPIFQYDGFDRDDRLGAIMLEKLIELHSVRLKHQLIMHTWFRDAGAYGFGVVMPYWDTKTRQRMVQPALGPMQQMMQTMGLNVPMPEATLEEEIAFEGNGLRNVDPYECLPDPNVGIHAIQDGEFFGRTYRDNYLNLLEEERHGKQLFNVRYLKGMTRVTSILRDNDHGRHTKSGVDDDGGIQATHFVDCVQMHIKLIPSDWELGDSDYPEVWEFTVGADQVLLGAEPMVYRHGMLPYCAIAPESDGYSTAPISMLEKIYPQQKIVDFDINQHVASQRKTGNDMLVADPSKVNVKDLMNPAPGRVIRLSRAYQGVPNAIKDAVTQLNYNDTTGNNIRDAMFLVEQMQRVTGVTDSVQGIAKGGSERRTALEVGTTRQSALSRLQKAAALGASMGMTDLAVMMASNCQQYMSIPLYARIGGRWEQTLREDYRVQGNEVLIDPSSIDVNYDVVPKNGAAPGGENVQAYLSFIQMLLQNPSTAMRVDLEKFAKHMARESGATDLGEFIRPETETSALLSILPDGQIPEQVAAGNLVPNQPEGQPGIL